MTLRVEIGIVPFGVEEEKRTIVTFDIFNKGPVEFGHCEYGIIEIDHERSDAGLYEQTVFHRRHLGALALVKKVLEKREKIIEEIELEEAEAEEMSRAA